MDDLNKDERHALGNILRRYLSTSNHELSVKENLQRVVNDYETYGKPGDAKEFKLLKDLIDEAVGS